MRNRLLHKGLSLLMAAGLLLSLSVPEALAAPEAGEAREEIALAVRFGLAALDGRDLG